MKIKTAKNKKQQPKKPRVRYYKIKFNLNRLYVQ